MRPEFHFTAASGWINDPHGITYRDGEYDAFFQYVPDRTDWAPNCHWGHARGADLLSLHELPVAIAPGDGDGGIWTGSLVTGDDGHARIFYTSTSEPDIGIGRIRVATPDDDEWISWTKGPFVVDAPADLDLIAYRDPFLREDPDGWRMFVGAGDAGGHRDGPQLSIRRLGHLGVRGCGAVTVDVRDRGRLDGCAVGMPADLRHRRSGRDGLFGVGRRRAPLRGVRRRHLHGRQVHRDPLGPAHLRRQLLRAVPVP